MNKVHIIVESILGVAVVALFVLHFCDRPKVEQQLVNADGELVVTKMPIAYLNLDSLLANYTLAQEASDQLMSKQEDARVKLNSKARTLQNEMADFQRKLENNAFLSRERAESEQQRLLRKQQELQDLEAKLTQDIMIETQNMNIRLADTLTNYLEEYNADGHYQMILSNQGHDNVLTAAEGYDITNEIIEALNARYKK